MFRLPTSTSGRVIQTLSRNVRSESTAAVSFQYPKAQALFEKITSSLDTAEQVHELQAILLRNLGRERRAKEFYYDGFTGGKGTRKADGADEEPAVVAPKAFDVKLVAYDAKAKIKVIKEVRSLLGLGLKEAKALVDSAPSVLQKQVTPETAEEIKAKLIEVGAEIELVS